MTSAMSFIPKSIRHTRRDCEQNSPAEPWAEVDEKVLGCTRQLALSSPLRATAHPSLQSRTLSSISAREARIHLAKFLRHAQCTGYFRIRQTGRGPEAATTLTRPIQDSLHFSGSAIICLE